MASLSFRSSFLFNQAAMSLIVLLFGQQLNSAQGTMLNGSEPFLEYQCQQTRCAGITQTPYLQ